MKDMNAKERRYMILEDDELLEINGGAVSIGLASALIGGIVFIIGIIDGYLRPLRCR